MIHQANRPVVVNLDGPIEKAVPHPFDVFVVAAVPVARLEGFDRLDGFEASDSGFQVGGGHPEQVSQCQRQRSLGGRSVSRPFGTSSTALSTRCSTWRSRRLGVGILSRMFTVFLSTTGT